MTGSPERATRRLTASTRIGAARVLELDDAAGEQKRPGRGVDEQAVGVAEVALPAAAGNLLGDELVGGVAVGNPEQRLGDAHQDDAFLAGEPVLAHEGVDAGVLALVGARRMDEAASDVGGAPALLLGEHRALDQAVEQPRLVDQMVSGDLVARRRAAADLILHLFARLCHLHMRPCCPRKRHVLAIRYGGTLANRETRRLNGRAAVHACR